MFIIFLIKLNDVKIKRKLNRISIKESKNWTPQCIDNLNCTPHTNQGKQKIYINAEIKSTDNKP